jgi:hypothetical protein
MRLEYREAQVLAWLRHEKDLLKHTVEAMPRLRKAYKTSHKVGYALYWWLAGIFAHGPYAYVALFMGVLVLLHPLFGGEE